MVLTKLLAVSIFVYFYGNFRWWKMCLAEIPRQKCNSIKFAGAEATQTIPEWIMASNYAFRSTHLFSDIPFSGGNEMSFNPPQSKFTVPRGVSWKIILTLICSREREKKGPTNFDFRPLLHHLISLIRSFTKTQKCVLLQKSEKKVLFCCLIKFFRK